MLRGDCAMTSELKRESVHTLRMRYNELKVEMQGAYRIYAAAKNELSDIESEMMDIVIRLMSDVEEGGDD